MMPLGAGEICRFFGGCLGYVIRLGAAIRVEGGYSLFNVRFEWLDILI